MWLLLSGWCMGFWGFFPGFFKRHCLTVLLNCAKLMSCLLFYADFLPFWGRKLLRVGVIIDIPVEEEGRMKLVKWDEVKKGLIASLAMLAIAIVLGMFLGCLASGILGLFY